VERPARFAVDWPFGYDELAPYYAEVERTLPVSGPRRSAYPSGAPYPHGELPWSAKDAVIGAGLVELGLNVEMTPHAIATTNVDGRSACMYYGFCKNGCKSDAKGGGHVSYVPRAVGAGAEIRPGCFVLRVESEGGRATGVTYLEERFQPVERVFVSCYSIETPRLLLRSEVANSSDQVRRNLMTHTGRSCTGASTGPWTASSVGENDRAIAAAGTELATRALEATGATRMLASEGTPHLLGSCRMGDDPATSVVGPDCRSHDVPNLWTCDGSVFPTGGAVNPSLTIEALATRTARLALAGEGPTR